MVAWFTSMQLAPAFSIVAMLLAAVVVAALVAPLCERGLLRMFYGRDEVLLVLVTFALFLIMEDLTKQIWGVNPLYVADPYMLFGVVEIGTLSYVGYDFMLVLVALIVGVSVWWGLNRTRFGKLVLAVIHRKSLIGHLASFPASETKKERETMQQHRSSDNRRTTPFASPTCSGRYPG
jgi:branched-chain amino acid transport system permease protein